MCVRVGSEGGYKTARGRRQKIMRDGLCLGKGQGKQQWEKLERPETKTISW